MVAMVIASSAATENSMTTMLTDCTPLLPTITSAVPSRPKNSPSHLILLTVSSEKRGIASATRIGCSEVIKATVPADPPSEKATHAVPKYTT